MADSDEEKAIREEGRRWYWGGVSIQPQAPAFVGLDTDAGRSFLSLNGQTIPVVGQVGGSHYGQGFGHWDWSEAYDVGYLEAAASKYLSRWEQKNGLEDLGKAETFLLKMGGRGARRLVPLNVLSAWAIAADVDPRDFYLIQRLVGETFGTPADVAYVLSMVQALIRERQACGGS